MKPNRLFVLFKKRAEVVLLRLSFPLIACLSAFSLLLSASEYWKDRDFQHLLYLLISLTYVLLLGAIALREFKASKSVAASRSR